MLDQLLAHLQNKLQITSLHHNSYLKRKLCINTAKATTFISKQKFIKLIEASDSLAKEIESDNNLAFSNNEFVALEKSV